MKIRHNEHVVALKVGPLLVQRFGRSAPGPGPDLWAFWGSTRLWPRKR